jgi:hypothetical protein
MGWGWKGEDLVARDKFSLSFANKNNAKMYGC